VAVSDHIREYTLRNYRIKNPQHLVTIHGGTDTRIFPYQLEPDPSWFDQVYNEFPELRSRRLLCLPGRLSRYKGHGVFIELIAALSEEFPDIQGVVVGKAKPGSRFRSELEGLADQSGILDRITFAGARMDIQNWMAASEIIFSLCSDPPEAFGRTVPEALHLGVPVIGWNHGGVQEVMSEMFPIGAVEADRPRELLRRTRDFLRDRPMVEKSRAFLLEDSMQRTLDLYRDACQATGQEGQS
jgi:glycosyltransferase involved in cell wall biosynthesis